MTEITGSNDAVTCHLEEGVAAIRLTAPERKNCFSIDLGEDLLELYRALEERLEQIAVVTLTAAGDVFCAGLDLDIVTNAEARPDERERLGDLYWLATGWLRNVSVPVVVGACSAAPGAGAGLAQSADILVTDEDFEIWWPEINVGIPPYDLGPKLARDLGWRRAVELTLLGREARLSATEAEALGLVNRVVPAGEVDDAVNDIARTLARHEHESGTMLDVYAVLHEHRRRSSDTSAIADWQRLHNNWFE